MRAIVTVMLKDGVLDPQGKAIAHALHVQGFGEVNEVRAGRVIELDIDARDRDAAEARVGEMARRLLANQVIESFKVEIV